MDGSNPISRDQVEAAITEILSNDFDVDPVAVRPDASMQALGLDSLDLIEISQFIEQQYGVRIPLGATAEINSLGDMIDFVMDAAASADQLMPPGGPRRL